jgi:PAS domain S-box-containing protein
LIDSAEEAVTMAAEQAPPAGVTGSEPGPALFREALEAASIAAVLTDLRLPDHPLVYVNPAFEQMTGYRAAEILGRNCRFLQGAEHAQPAVAEIRAAIAARRPLTILLRNFRKDGRPFWNELTLSPLYGTDGEATHYVGFQQDVSFREEAQVALAHREAKARALLESTPAAIITADLETQRVSFVNRPFEALTGRSRSELLGTDPMDLHPRAARGRVEQAFLAMLGGQLELVADIPLLRPDGRIIPVEIRGSHGELDGRRTVFAVFTDQSARRAAEADAARQLARLAATLAGHPDQVLVLDGEGRIVESLRRGVALLGAAGDGQRLSDGLSPAATAELALALRRVQETAMPVTVELWLGEGQAARCEELRLRPLPEQQLLALIRDVTQARRAEAALRESEAEFRQLFETLPQGVVYQLADGSIVRANPAACRLLGLSMEQLLGRDSLHPDWRAVREDASPFPGHAHPAMAALATGQPVDGVTMGVFRPDRGDLVWLLVSALPEFRDGETRPWRVSTSFTDITAQRRASDELAQSRDLFEQAGRLARIGAWEFDVESGRAIWSAVTKSIHEVPENYQPTLADGLRFCCEESRQRASRAIETAIAGGGMFDEELEIETALGNRRWIRATGRGIYEQGRCVRMYGTFQDITEHQQRLQQLTWQGELQRILMDIAATYINLPLEQLDAAIEQSLAQLGEFSGADRFYVFSYDFERMTTSNTHEWCAPGIAPQLPLLQDYPLVGMEPWIEAHRRGQPMQIADVLQLPLDHALRIALEPQGIRTIVALPLMRDGACIGFVGMDYVHGPHRVRDPEMNLLSVFAQMLVNVSIRRSMLRELTESRNFLADVIENSGSLISIKDLDGRYLSVNQRWESVYRLPREAAVGRADGELLEARLAATLRAGDQAVLRGGQLRECEEALDTPSGHRRFYTVRFPVRDRDGHIYGIAAMASDITEHQRLEEERQARQLAEAANRDKSAFLAKMSHEIRTPLNAIIGFSRRLMDDQTLKPASAEQIRTVHRSATHLLSMLNDLLDYARIESGRSVVEEQEFDLYGLLDDLAAMFRFRCEEKRLRFLFHWDAALPRHARGDAGKLRQIVMNLLGNAIKFTNQGHVSLRARRGSGSSNSFKLEVEVEDSGEGVGADELPHLFDEFWQGRAGKASGGTGLGLPIAQQLLKLLGGGPIQVASEPGHGSSFRFLLPLRLVRSDSERMPTPDPDSVALPVVPVLPALSRPDDAEVARAVAALSPALLGGIRDALARGEMSVFRELIGNLAEVPATVCGRLLELAAAYDYPRLAQLLGNDDSAGEAAG